MKIGIIFYSFSGNTKRACDYLKERFSSEGITVELIELKPSFEEKSFFKQCQQAFFKAKPELEEVSYDLSEYKFLIFASAVWAFTFTPALRTYLNKVTGLDNKNTASLITYGSGTGSKKALRELEMALRDKGARVVFSKLCSGDKTKDKNHLKDVFASLEEVIKMSL